jgi:hypothetical protein
MVTTKYCVRKLRIDGGRVRIKEKNNAPWLPTTKRVLKVKEMKQL